MYSELAKIVTIGNISHIMKIIFNRSYLFAIFSVIIIGVSHTTVAQDDTLVNNENDSSSSIVDYPATFFTRYKPNTALDMVQQVPGFQVDDGDASREFAEAAGNLLINGQRPSAKQDRPSAILSRIPASQVISIKLIRGQIKGIDLRGQTTVVDVLLSNDSPAAISWEGFFLYSTASPIKPGIKASLSDHWRDIEYNLGIDIERDANGEFGNEYIFDENNGLVEERNESQTETGLTTGLFMNVSSYLGDTFINVNGKFGMGNSPEVLNSSRLPLVGDPRNIFIRDDQHSETYELGVDAERDLSEDLTGKVILLFINRLSDVTSTQTSRDLQGSQILFRQADTVTNLTEGIARLEIDWSGLKNHAIQLNIEGAYNDLDGSLFQTEDAGAGAIIVDIPGGNTRVEESRGDFLLKDTWSLGQFELDYGLGAEVSTISQSGDEEQNRIFFFLTPQSSLSYSPEQGQQTRVRLAREIAQLNFNDFISTTVFEDDDLALGNPNLKPDKTWVAELSHERQFDNENVMKVTVFHHWITDVLDLLPLTSTFEVPGNIGDGRRWGIELENTLPLARLALKWSTNTGHRVKAVNCQNEVNDDDTKTNKTEVYRRLQTRCGSPGY